MYRLLSCFKNNFDKMEAVYSVDKVVLKGELIFNSVKFLFDYLDRLNRSIDCPIDKLPFGQIALMDIVYKERTESFCYHHNFNFVFFDTRDKEQLSFWFGFGLIDCDRNVKDHWKLEFNPNKVGEFEAFQEFYKFLYTNTKKRSLELVEYDLAIDYPFARSEFCLIRTGRRIYQQIRKSKNDMTEYLGKRHTNGYVKLYNKTIESNLTEEKTRLELTLTELSFKNLQKVFPNLRLKPQQLNFLEDVVDDDFIVLYCILENSDLIHLLSYNQTKRRYLRKLDELSQPLQPDAECFNVCVNYLLTLLRMDAA